MLVAEHNAPQSPVQVHCQPYYITREATKGTSLFTQLCPRQVRVDILYEYTAGASPSYLLVVLEYLTRPANFVGNSRSIIAKSASRAIT